MEFNIIKQAVQAQLKIMTSDPNIDLFVVDVEKNELWDMYLASFPEGTNPIYKERTEHDCQCCKQFIRACGGVVAIVNGGQMLSIWDIDVGGEYQVVADALSDLVKSKPVKSLYRHYQAQLGTDYNFGDDGKKWGHFHHTLPARFVMPNAEIASFQGDVNSAKQVFARALNELTVESFDIVLDLIGQNSIYRGDEFKAAVQSFKDIKKLYDELPAGVDQDLFCWVRNLTRTGALTKFRSTVIGTLLVDLSDGVDLVDAVKMYESKVAPENYKRPTALITQGMIKKAQATIIELGGGGSPPPDLAPGRMVPYEDSITPPCCISS